MASIWQAPERPTSESGMARRAIVWQARKNEDKTELWKRRAAARNMASSPIAWRSGKVAARWTVLVVVACVIAFAIFDILTKPDNIRSQQRLEIRVGDELIRRAMQRKEK